MIRSVNLENLLARVNLYDFRTYLEVNGWRRLPVKNSKWTIYKLGSSDFPIEVILPTQDRYSDVGLRVAEAVNIVGQIEGRSPQEICQQIIGTNSDSLLVRLNIPSSSASIPISDAPKHVKAIRNMVLYSACSEVDEKPYYEIPLPSAEELISEFNFCHTFQGSFGFEVSAALARPSQIDDLFEPPKTRRIVERLARGLKLLNEAVETEQPEILISSYGSAFNARVCDAITDISIDGKVKFNLGVEWANSIVPAEDVKEFHDVSIGEQQISMLRFVSEQLKVVAPRPDVVIGPVINLHCVSNPVENGSRRIVALKVRHELHGVIEVKLNLGADDYLLAIAAHTNAKKLSATGQLQRKGSVWSIEAITSVSIVG